MPLPSSNILPDRIRRRRRRDPKRCDTPPRDGNVGGLERNVHFPRVVIGAGCEEARGRHELVVLQGEAGDDGSGGDVGGVGLGEGEGGVGGDVDLLAAGDDDVLGVLVVVWGLR